MTFAEAVSDAALAALALEFYRAPARFPSLRDPGQPLPGDPAILLKLASGVSRDALGLTPAAGTAESLREAAMFFVQQVLLVPGADHYRVHGLTPDASEERIKENHRLLMRIFHPDRDAADPGNWHVGFASRINQAYSILRDASKRREYDRALASGIVAKVGLNRPDRPSLRVRSWSERELSRGAASTPLGRYLWRHLPKLVLGATTLLAAAGVGLVWWNNRPSGAIGSGSGEMLRPAGAASALARSEPPEGVQISGREQRQRLPLLDDTVTAAAKPEVRPSVPPTVNGEGRQEHLLEPGRSEGGGTPNEAGLGAQRQLFNRESMESMRAADDVRPISGMAGNATQTVAPDPSHKTAAPGPLAPEFVRSDIGLAELEPTRVIPEFARRYARGDVDAFMELFDANARNETGGYAKIRKDYDELFNSTSQRQIFVWDMRWIPQDGRIWRGEGHFQARVRRKDETSARHYDGIIRMEVSAQGERPLIRELYHVLADGSH